jgi:hypothetical protein
MSMNRRHLALAGAAALTLAHLTPSTAQAQGSDAAAVAAAVEALTGEDRWAEWAGRYITRHRALRLLHEYGGGGFTEAFNKFFGAEPVLRGLARRGDVLEYVDAVGEQHLGVCIGANVAVLGEAGLAFVKLSQCRHAWRVG